MVIGNTTTTLLALALFAGCMTTESASGRVAVAENDLGVVAIEIDHFHDNGDVFELRGIDAAGGELAHVRARKGIVDGLPKVEDPNAIGTEIELVASDDRERWITWETQRFEVQPYHDAIQRFTELPAVASALERELHLTTIRPHQAAAESAYTSGAGQCAADQLLTTPTAQHCCADSLYGSPLSTIFLRPSDGSLIRRSHSYGYGNCKSSSGGACNGADCYYGPIGYTRPLIDASTGYGWSIVVAYYWDGATLNVYCSASTTTYNPPQFTYGDVTGTSATGQGCPGGATGAGQWDY